MTATTTAERTLGTAIPETAAILQRSVCVLLLCSGLGNHKKVDAGTLDIKTREGGAEVDEEAKRQLTMGKKLVDSEELAGCSRVLQAAKDYLGSISIPGHRVFGAGTHLVPLTLAEEADERLLQLKADLAARVDELAAKWERVVADARAQLGPLFDPKDYATTAQVRAAWSLRWSFVDFSTPDRLEHVSRAVYERAQQDFRQRCNAAASEWVTGLRANALKVMRELAERLAPGADGKRKAVRGTALDDLTELLERLPHMNIGDDDSLADVLASVHARVAGLDAEALRKNDTVREMVRGAAEQAVSALDGLVRSGRAISFEDLA